MQLARNHSALRRGRISVPGRVYFLSATTLARKPWFSEHELAAHASRVLAARVIWRNARLLAWVLMPDHWHGIVVLRSGGCLSDCMLRMKSAVAREVNSRVARRGSLWAKGSHDRALRGRREIIAACRYLLLNPVHAGLASGIGTYPYWNCEWIGPWCDRVRPATPVSIRQAKPPVHR